MHTVSETDRTLDEFKRQAGILGKTIQNNGKAANAIVNASFHHAKFSDRIWMYQDMLKADLSKLLQEGLIQGRNPRQLARHLTKRFGVAKSDAERLMRTELARVQTEAQKQSFERNGYDQYEFIALGSACGICRELDGKHFEVAEMMPGENAPPMHPNCRCSVAAHVDEEEFEAWIDFLDKGGTTEEWKRLKRESSLESDTEDGISEFFKGISKQKTDFKKSLDAIENNDLKILLQQSFNRVTIKRAKGRRSKYSAKDKIVYLSKSANTDALVHELMHEIDGTYGLTQNGMLNKSVQSDYRRLENLSKGYGKSIEEMLYLKYPKAFREDTQKLALKEKYRGVSDIINGMSKGNITLGYGHSKGYWGKSGNVEAETFAQIGRILYDDLSEVKEMLKDVCPNCYEEVAQRIERMIK